jgi:hypothetical protein
MKKSISIATFFVFCVLNTTAFAEIPAFAQAKTWANSLKTMPLQAVEAPNSDFCGISNEAFQAGEKLTYKVYYNLNFVWIPAGEVVFNVEDNGTMYHLVANGRTFSSYEWFFKLRDRYESFVDKKTLQPVTSIRDVSEGNYKLFARQTFDHINKKVAVEQGDARNATTKTVHSFSGCVHDLMSIIYYARNMNPSDYAADARIPIKVFMDKQVYTLNVHYKGKEKNKVVKESGTYNTYKFTPEMVKGEVFREATGMMVYCSDDKNRTPVLIESPLSVGYIKVILTKTEGLRNQNTAKIK